MKINLLPLSLLGQLVSKVTCLGTIQRAYKTLYASCERLAIVIGDAAEVVPTNYEKRSWMQNQLRYKISGASSDLNDALEMLLCHDGLRNGKEDTTEMVDWQTESVSEHVSTHWRAKSTPQPKRSTTSGKRLSTTTDSRTTFSLAGGSAAAPGLHSRGTRNSSSGNNLLTTNSALTDGGL